jgi:PKD repeat protein
MWSFSVNTSTTTDDQDINTLSYTWDFGDGSLGQSGTGLTSVNHTYSATGIYIITVTAEDDFGATDEATVSISIVDDLDDCVLTSAMALPAQTNTFTNQCADCLPKLRPWQGKPYWVSVWVAEDTSLLCGRPPVGALVTVTFTPEDGGSATEINLAPSGPVIEGWQKIEGKIDVPADYAKMTISLGNDNVGSTDIDLYYDDFRFHPWQSNMQSYVYDPVSMRLMATLDENNYANFYEYDDEGILVRVKRETEKGVMTVQETRTVMRKE